MYGLAELMLSFCYHGNVIMFWAKKQLLSIEKLTYNRHETQMYSFS